MTNMFSADDAREVLQLFSSEGDLNSPLIFSTHGDGLVTRKYVHQAFTDLVTKVYTTQRVYTSSLGRDLGVSVETVRNLVDEYDGTLILRNGNDRQVITKPQRDTIDQDLRASIVNGVISKNEFARKHDLSQSSLGKLINLSEIRIAEVDGYLYSTLYDTTVTSAIATSLMDCLEKLKAVEFDSKNVPGSPPVWFTYRTINCLVKDSKLTGKFYIQEQPESVRCTPIQLVRHIHDTSIDELQSGRTAYLDLRSFQRDNQAIYPSIEDVQINIRSVQDVDVVETFAISEAWVSKFSKECLSGLARDDGVEIGHPLKAVFPDSLHAVVVDRVEQRVCALLTGVHRIGDCILNESGYTREKNELLNLAKLDAASQWQQLKENPKMDVKFSLLNITSQFPTHKTLWPGLVRERTIERALEDTFSAEISELEKQNEAEFAEYWIDRVATRTAVYTEGLTALGDQKLQGQLSELLAQYLHKDLVPDAISKATSQGLVLSRKTRKNVQKLESALNAGGIEVPALVSSLEKFNKKQSIEGPAPSALKTAKTTMLNDMARRMQKQKKSDGPLLFLTLIVFLFATHNAGVIYATGKFAPKLLKHLKTVLDAEQYVQLETWKEAAKAGTLSAEDRDAMKMMVEARV